MNLDAVTELAPLFRADREVRPVLLLGAGASYRSGVPLAAEAIGRITRAVLRHQWGPDAQVRPTDIDAHLRRQEWFNNAPERFAENFPLVVKNLLAPREFRREVLLEIISPDGDLSRGYHALAQLAQRGLLRTILTTNFDRCLARTFEAHRPNIRHFNEVGRFEQDIRQFAIYPASPQIVYLHGTIEDYSDRNTEDEIKWIDELVSAAIGPMVEHSPLVVIGYAGAEPSIMDNFLLKLSDRPSGFRNGLYWCILKGTQPHEKVKALQSKVGQNFSLIEIDGFDEIVTDLEEALRDEDMYRTVAPANIGQAPNTTDEQPVEGATIETLDLGAALIVLTEYCARLRRPAVDGHTLKGLLRDLALTMATAKGDVPSLAGLLLFGRSPESHLSHAVVEVLRDGKRFRVVTGNLIQQYSELSELLGLEEINPIIKLKKATTWDYRQAYPARALNELLLNMLVHRDYGVGEPARISVFPGDRIEFLNSGGLPQQVISKVQMADSGQFNPRRSVSAIRNPGLADIFAGWGRMEKAGTGLVDTEELVRQNGGDAAFYSEGGNTSFRAVLLQPRQKERKKQATALPRTPFGVFVTNHLRFVRVPEAITIAEVKNQSNSQQSEDQIQLQGFETNVQRPLVIRQKTRVLSFAPLKTVGDVAAIQMSVNEFLKLPGGWTGFVWLMREHFAVYLGRLESTGLIQLSDGHRAYFRRIDDEKTTIRYAGQRGQPVKRDVVKRREGAKYVIHENEGIVYSVVNLDGHWAMQIKPFYMFTSEDGITPLSGIRRISLSTRRMKFDRNANVLSDLNFWARFLAQGNASIQLSPSSEYDLILNGAFEQFEAIEEKIEAP